MKILAFDPSTFTGIVCLDGDTVLAAQEYNPIAKGFERVQLVHSMVHGLCTHYEPDCAVIEAYAFNIGGKIKQSPSSIVLQVEIGTLIRLALRQCNIPWWEIGPSALKKWTTGLGNAKKPEMAVSVFDRWQFMSKSDDVIDAYALARFAQHLQGNPSQLFKGVTYEAS